jgi:hypothetical protein
VQKRDWVTSVRADFRRVPHLIQNAFASTIEALHFSQTVLTSLLISLPSVLSTWPLHSGASR